MPVGPHSVVLLIFERMSFTAAMSGHALTLLSALFDTTPPSGQSHGLAQIRVKGAGWGVCAAVKLAVRVRAGGSAAAGAKSER